MRTITFISIAAFILFSCKENDVLKLQDSDSTAPKGKWLVTDSSGTNGVVTREFTEENNEFDISPHTKISVTYTVEDSDGGVQKVAMTGGGLTACTLSLQDDIAEISLPTDTTILAPGKNKEVQATASRNASLDLACRKKDGEVFPQVARGPGGTIELHGYGENFHSGTVRSRLVIKTTPL